MGLFSKYTPEEPREGRYGEKSGVPETISDKKWDRLHDSLPFPVDPDAAADAKDLTRRVNFGHQRFGKPWLS